MRNKLIGFMTLLVVVGGTGLLVGQLKENPKAAVSASTDHYAATAVQVGDRSFNVELAVTQDQQALGLSNRDSIPANSGMLFVFKPAEAATFWMKDMRFPLDMIWIYQGQVVAVDRDLPIPTKGTKTSELPTYSPGKLVDYVLEVKAGGAGSINVGDKFQLATSFSA